MASDRDVLRALLRALGGKHVCDSGGDADGISHLDFAWSPWNQIPVTLGNIVGGALWYTCSRKQQRTTRISEATATALVAKAG